MAIKRIYQKERDYMVNKKSSVFSPYDWGINIPCYVEFNFTNVTNESFSQQMNFMEDYYD